LTKASDKGSKINFAISIASSSAPLTSQGGVGLWTKATGLPARPPYPGDPHHSVTFLSKSVKLVSKKGPATMTPIRTLIARWLGRGED
jgi:hypothetical protein